MQSVRTYHLQQGVFLVQKTNQQRFFHIEQFHQTFYYALIV